MITLLNLDCLIAAHEAQEDTKAQQRAWEWLATLSAVETRGGCYLVPSATTPGRVYRVTAQRCECEAAGRGLCCWHRSAAAVLDLARENETVDALADVMELF